MVEGTKINPKIPQDKEDSLDLKSLEVKEEDDAVFLFPSIASLKKLFVKYININIYIYVCMHVCILLDSYFYVIEISNDKTQFTYLLSVIVFHIVCITCLLSIFRKDRYETNQNIQS